ncbi:hypothetical protein JHU04_001053 [Brenneria sp. 4F2]|nr:hypothetical protein [Brenneria bubanii]
MTRFWREVRRSGALFSAGSPDDCPSCARFEAIFIGQQCDDPAGNQQRHQYPGNTGCACAHLARAGIPQQPVDLAQHSCLHYRFPNSGKLETWPLAKESELHIPISMVCNNIETRVCFALRGLGIACLPDFSVAAGRLRRVLEDYVERTVSLHVVWPSGRYMTPKLRAFIDFLSANLFVSPSSGM